MQLVRLNRRQSVREHPLVIERVHLSHQRRFDLLWLATHQRGGRPYVRQIIIVRETTPKLSILNLPMINVPKHEAVKVSKLLRLSKGP